ncbi:MAG: prolyl oligopeptidase family serine peptidase [Lentisphaeria bacterium]|nr:prolyl oligopeptidase family serine peptidase [Lentisphaeria bacterium]NQZ68995.1 prolyl oligopeptidase family serine peptidase [Lentisphaeria bacterium]
MTVRKFYVHMLVTLLLVGLISTSYGEEGPRTGIFIYTLKFGNGKAMKFKAQVPKKLPKEKTLGLILAFHPHGGNESSMVNWPSKTFLERQKVLDDYVIIGLKSRGPKGYKEHLGDWEIADHEPSYQTFQWAMKTYPIDSRRVHIIGWSRGGFMATRFIWNNLKHFATVTAFAGAHSPDWTSKSLGGYPNQDWVKLKQSKGTRIDYSVDFSKKSLTEYLPKSRDRKVNLSEYLPEFYHVHGDRDYVIDVNLTRSFTRELGKIGLRFIYRELDGVNHAGVFQGKPVNFAVNDDVFAWINATRNKILPLNETDRKTLATIEKNISTMASTQAIALIKEASRIGGHQGGKALIKAFDSKFVDVRVAAVTSGYTTSYGPAFIAKLGELIRDPKREKDVRFNACHVLGTYAKWRQLDAQKILTDTVLDPSLSQYIRFQLITAISRSYEFMVAGNMYDDRKIIQTLVKLLDDPNVGVRGYAHMVLKKGTNGIGKFGYNASHNKSERQAPVSLWNKWAAQITVPLLSDNFVKKRSSEIPGALRDGLQK